LRRTEPEYFRAHSLLAMACFKQCQAVALGSPQITQRPSLARRNCHFCCREIGIFVNSSMIFFRVYVLVFFFCFFFIILVNSNDKLRSCFNVANSLKFEPPVAICLKGHDCRAYQSLNPRPEYFKIKGKNAVVTNNFFGVGNGHSMGILALGQFRCLGQQTVAHSRFGDEQFGTAGTGFDFLPQMRDIDP
jgi:hypothetical protein